MDDGIFRLRVAQQLHQRKHTVKVEVRLGKFGGMFQAIIYERIEVIEGFVVSGFYIHAWDCKAEFGIRKLENKTPNLTLPPKPTKAET